MGIKAPLVSGRKLRAPPSSKMPLSPKPKGVAATSSFAVSSVAPPSTAAVVPASASLT